MTSASWKLLRRIIDVFLKIMFNGCIDKNRFMQCHEDCHALSRVLRPPPSRRMYYKGPYVEALYITKVSNNKGVFTYVR